MRCACNAKKVIPQLELDIVWSNIYCTRDFKIELFALIPDKTKLVVRSDLINSIFIFPELKVHLAGISVIRY